MLLSMILQIMGSHFAPNTTEVKRGSLRYFYENDSYILDGFSTINFDINLNSELLDNVNLNDIVLSMYSPSDFFNRTKKTDIKITPEKFFIFKNTAKDDLLDDFPGIPGNTNKTPIFSLLVANANWKEYEIIYSKNYFKKASSKMYVEKKKAVLHITRAIKYTKTHYDPQSPLLNASISLLETLLEIINDESGYHNILSAINQRFDSFENHVKQTVVVNEELPAYLHYYRERCLESLYSFISSINEYHRTRKIYLNRQRLLNTFELTKVLIQPGVSFKIRLSSKQGNTDILLASERTTVTKLEHKFIKAQYKKMETQNKQRKRVYFRC